MSINTMLGIGMVLLDLSFVWATKSAIDIATHRPSPIPSLTAAFWLLAVLMAARIALSFCASWVGAILGVKASNTVRRHVFRHLLNSQWQPLRSLHTGDIMNRLETDVDSVVSFVTQSLPQFITTIVQFAGAFLFLFYMDSVLACVVVIILPFFLLASKLYVKKLKALTHEVRTEDSRIQSLMQETLQHVMVVKTLMRTALFTQRLDAMQRDLHGKIIHRTKFSSVSSTVTTMGFATGYLVAFIWGTVNLEQGTITYGAMIAFIQLVNKIQSPVQSLTKFVPLFIRTSTSTERIMEIAHMPQECTQGTPALPTPLGIRFSHVSFAYSQGERNVLDDFTYTFRPGQATAIVGETGAGKTTLIKMLFSLVTPQKGEVALVDAEGKEWPISAEQRAQFCYVPQGNTLFSGTIRSNLMLGNPDATEEEMRRALQLAEANFVNERPEGLDAPCGETGDGLSEGQAQRVAIARALLTPGRVLVFDEATSALDADTERKVLKNIATHYPHTTAIFITHREEVLNHVSETLHMHRAKYT